MNIWGPTRAGKDGVMDEEDFVAFVVGKVGGGSAEWTKNVRKAFNAISNHDGQGGGTSYIYKGNRVFHISEGKNGRNQGVSVFFTCAGKVNASVIGIGCHIKVRGAKTHSYEFNWKRDNWDIPDKISI